MVYLRIAVPPIPARIGWLLGGLLVMGCGPSFATGTCSDPRSSACAGSGPPASSAPAPIRLDGVLMVDPSQGRTERRLSGAPWIAPVWDAAPLAVNPADTGFGMQTSVGHWGAYSTHTLTRRSEDAKGLAMDGFKLPRALPRPDPSLDVWASVEARNVNGEAAQETGSRVGADYRIGRQALVGASIGVQGRESVGAAAGEDSTTLATYFALKAARGLQLEARAGVGEKHATALQAAPSDAQRFTFLQLRSDWTLGAYKLSPALALAHGESAALPHAGARAPETDAVTFSPRLSRSVDVGQGRRLEPFLSYQRKLELAPDAGLPGEKGVDKGASRAETKYGAGVTLVKPDAYSFSVTTDLEETGTNAQSNLKSRFELKIPLR